LDIKISGITSGQGGGDLLSTNMAPRNGFANSNSLPTYDLVARITEREG